MIKDNIDNFDLGDANLKESPEPNYLVDNVEAIFIGLDEMIGFQSLGNYDNIGLSFNKDNIADYINSYKNISRPLKMTVLHNSGTAAKSDKGLTTVKSFNSYHLSKGWKCIGYHWIISTDGIIYAGRKMDYLGSHAGSKGNPNSIGVCLVGNFESSDRPTEKQKEAFAALHLALHKRFYNKANLTVRFHREFMSTGCPGNITVKEVMGWVEKGNSNIGKIIVDNINIGEVLLIDGVSYVKPRDFEKAGYSIGWDSNTKTVFINKPK